MAAIAHRCGVDARAITDQYRANADASAGDRCAARSHPANHVGDASRPPGGIGAPNSLASGGTLGGSQAGARLFYNISPSLAVVLRSSSDVGRRGGEVAAGIRYQPSRSVPV